LKRRVESTEKLGTELAAWESKRNTDISKINWHFTNDQARIKLISLYPKIIPIAYVGHLLKLQLINIHQIRPLFFGGMRDKSAGDLHENATRSALGKSGMQIFDSVFRANSAKKRRISGYLTLFLQENARKTGRKDACMTFRAHS
jgi:hypothetical protein